MESERYTFHQSILYEIYHRGKINQLLLIIICLEKYFNQSHTKRTERNDTIINVVYIDTLYYIIKFGFSLGRND